MTLSHRSRRARRLLLPLALATLLAPAGGAAQAGIRRLEIRRIEPAFEGRAFGTVGRYETVVGVAHGALDPRDPRNAGIVGLDRAPRDAAGMVEYSVDVYLLKPVDMARSSRTLLYDVVNRGNKVALSMFGVGAGGGNEPRAAADAGDGFLLERGYTLVWSGWQGNLRPGGDRLAARFPVARAADGGPASRWITVELIVRAPVRSLPLGWEAGDSTVIPYPPVEESRAAARLYRRAGPHAPRSLVPRGAWGFARCEGADLPEPSRLGLCLPAGFSPDSVYELVYEARDPVVLGMGFAATRDLVAFLRYDSTPANPLISRGEGVEGIAVDFALGFGNSQSGRFLKDFVHQGFNQERAGRRVFDGVILHVTGARRTFTNAEFAMPGRYSLPVEGHYAPGDQFPFGYETTTDPVSGERGGLLERCRAGATCPLLMHWDSGTEAWGGRGSLVVTDPTGTRPLPVPANVRLYYFAGTHHGGGTDAPPSPAARGICEHLPNPLSYRESQRALLVAMEAWVRAGRLPPPSRYPGLEDGTLVAPDALAFPAIPGVRHGPRVNDLFLPDSAALPPAHSARGYPLLVPRVDADGNEVGGIRSAALQAPLGTHAGWNTRRAGFMEGESCGLTGSYLPFARTAAERGSDPRPSLQERYRTRAGYLAAVRAATERLRAEGFLLPVDAARLLREAGTRETGLP